MWGPSEFSRLYMAFVYDMPTLQLMLQLLIDHMISPLEVCLFCYSTIAFSFDYLFILNL